MSSTPTQWMRKGVSGETPWDAFDTQGVKRKRGGGKKKKGVLEGFFGGGEEEEL